MTLNQRPSEVRRVLDRYTHYPNCYSWGRGDIAPLLAYIAKLEASAYFAAERTRVSAPVATWQPNSTAPKDGTMIDLWGDFIRQGESWGQDRIAECYWRDSGWYHTQRGEIEPHRFVPTHWQPLPPAPVEGQG
jgi:hypothetical protein